MRRDVINLTTLTMFWLIPGFFYFYFFEVYCDVKRLHSFSSHFPPNQDMNTIAIIPHMFHKLYLQTQPALFMKWRQRCLFRGSMWFYLTLPFCCYLVSWSCVTEKKRKRKRKTKQKGTTYNKRQHSKSLKKDMKCKENSGTTIYNIQYLMSGVLLCFVFFVCMKGLHQKMRYFKIKKESKELGARSFILKRNTSPLNNI